MTGIPPEAITAAAEVLSNVVIDGCTVGTGDEIIDAAAAKLMLEAAAPHLAAAGREAIIGYQVAGKLYHPADVVIIRQDAR